MIVSGIFLSVLILLVIGCCWCLWVNEVTLKQRLKIIDRIGDFNAEEIADGIFHKYHNRFADFTSVSYQSHLWELFWFRDPKKLYPEEIQQFVD